MNALAPSTRWSDSASRGSMRRGGCRCRRRRSRPCARPRLSRSRIQLRHSWQRRTAWGHAAACTRTSGIVALWTRASQLAPAVSAASGSAMVAPLGRRRWALSLVPLTVCPSHSEVGSPPARAYWPHPCRVFSPAHCTPSRAQLSMPQPGLPVLIPWYPAYCANQHEHVAVVGVSNSDGSLLLTSALDRCLTRPLGPWKSVDMEIQGSW